MELQAEEANSFCSDEQRATQILAMIERGEVSASMSGIEYYFHTKAYKEYKTRGGNGIAE